VRRPSSFAAASNVEPVVGRRTEAVALAVLVAATTAGCIDGGREKSFPTPGAIDVAAGSYREVALGDPTLRTQNVFGSKEAVHDELIAPVNTTVDDYYGAPVGLLGRAGPSADVAIYRYAGVVFLAFDGTIEEIGLTEVGASTERGVEIGDELERAKVAYPEIACDTANEGSKYRNYPGCTGRVGERFVWFGGDPIKTIELSTSRFFF
jgi:hypothetical protein